MQERTEKLKMKVVRSATYIRTRALLICIPLFVLWKEGIPWVVTKATEGLPRVWATTILVLSVLITWVLFLVCFFYLFSRPVVIDADG